MAKKKTAKATKTKQVVRKKEMKGKELLFVLAIVAVFGIVFWLHRGSNNVVNAPATTPEPTPIEVTFNCPNGQKIGALFNNSGAGNVTVTMPDGTVEVLPHAMSADGARYANSDESFVFWNVGDSVMIQQNGVTTYQDCTTTSN